MRYCLLLLVGAMLWAPLSYPQTFRDDTESETYIQARTFRWSEDCSTERGSLIRPLDTNDARMPADPPGLQYLRECVSPQYVTIRRALVLFADPAGEIVADVYDPNGQLQDSGYGKWAQRLRFNLQSCDTEQSHDGDGNFTGGKRHYCPGGVWLGSDKQRPQLEWSEPFDGTAPDGTRYYQQGSVLVRSQ